MRIQQIDLGHKLNQSPGEPIPYWSREEADHDRQRRTQFELERLERNVRAHLEELAKPV